MRLNLNLRGVDLLSVEFHAGSKGLFLDVDWFKNRAEDDDRPSDGQIATTGDLTGTSSGVFERAEHVQWSDDQPALVRGFGFQKGTS